MRDSLLLPLVALLLCAAIRVHGSPSLVQLDGNCKFEVNGTSYDFSSLAGKTFRGEDAGYRYELAACGTLSTAQGYSVAQFDQMDVRVAGMAKPDGAKWSRWSEGSQRGVQSTFTNGDSCWIGTPQVRITNIIHMCSEQTDYNFTVVESPTCTFTIKVFSPFACGGTGPQINSCNYTEPVTKLRFDLTPMKAAGDVVVQSGGYTWTMAMCQRSVKTGACQYGGFSACQYSYRGDFVAGLGGFDRRPNGGWGLIANDPTVGVTQTYSNGEPCATQSGDYVPRTIIIQVYCAPDGKIDAFEFKADHDKCVFTYTYHAPTGCPFR